MIHYNHLLCLVFLSNCFSSYPILSCQDLMPVMFLDLYGNLYVCPSQEDEIEEILSQEFGALYAFFVLTFIEFCLIFDR